MHNCLDLVSDKANLSKCSLKSILYTAAFFLYFFSVTCFHYRGKKLAGIWISTMSAMSNLFQGPKKKSSLFYNFVQFLSCCSCQSWGLSDRHRDLKVTWNLKPRRNVYKLATWQSRLRFAMVSCVVAVGLGYFIFFIKRSSSSSWSLFLIISNIFIIW